MVEDEAIIALSESLVLERDGYLVITTGSGEQAVNLVREHPEIDLVLMDIDLGPGIDGIEAADRILSEREVPIVFLTGHAEPSMVDRVRGITRYGYVMKNTGDFVLLQAIAMGLGLFETHIGMQAEVETRRRTEEELLGRNRFIETILDNLPIGLAVSYIDEGTATYMNREFEEIYGWPKTEITEIREFFERVYPDPEYRDTVMQRIMTDINSGDPERMQWDDIQITAATGALESSAQRTYR